MILQHYSDSEQYLIEHNVSSDQTPIITNRTSVTLYGVKWQKTYTVNIYPFKNCMCNTSYDYIHVDMLVKSSGQCINCNQCDTIEFLFLVNLSENSCTTVNAGIGFQCKTVCSTVFTFSIHQWILQ